MSKNEKPKIDPKDIERYLNFRDIEIGLEDLSEENKDHLIVIEEPDYWGDELKILFKALHMAMLSQELNNGHTFNVELRWHANNNLCQYVRIQFFAFYEALRLLKQLPNVTIKAQVDVIFDGYMLPIFNLIGKENVFFGLDAAYHSSEMKVYYSGGTRTDMAISKQYQSDIKERFISLITSNPAYSGMIDKLFTFKSVVYEKEDFKNELGIEGVFVDASF